MDRLCRVCMDSSVTLVDIFAERQQLSKKDPSLAEMLNEFCEVKQKDMLPQNICLSCVLATQNAYKFKRTCEETQRQLLQLLAIRNQDSTKYIVPFVQAVYQNGEIPINLNCIKVEPMQEDEVITGDTVCPPTYVNPKEKSVQSRQTTNNQIRHKQQNAKEYPHNCKFCGKGFCSLYPMRLHEKRHTGEKTFFCATCGKGFIRGHDLKIHTRIHTGERFQCPHCPRSFIQKHILKTHLQNHITQDPQEQPINSVKEIAAKKPMTKSKVPNTNITVQQKPQKTLTALERGLRDKLPPVSYEELDIECELNDIDTTVNIDHLPTKFKFNQKCFNKPKNLSVIIKDQKDRKKPKKAARGKQQGHNVAKILLHFCETCGKGFPRRYGLTQHTRIHTGERPYKCSICPSAFTQGQALKRHVRRLHNNQKELQILPPIKRVVVRVARVHLPRVLTY